VCYCRFIVLNFYRIALDRIQITENYHMILNAAPPVGPSPAWCLDSNGTAHSFDQFLQRITAFHGYAAPGLVIGGKMVDLAMAAMPNGCLFDAISETDNCLPDAIQLLTPCTVGNGWLKVLKLGRFALALYEKKTGEGIRVYLHPRKVAAWEEIDNWFFKRRPKAEQDPQGLLAEIKKAGGQILQTEKIRVHPRLIYKASVDQRALCPDCGESFPSKHGPRCRACQGASPYESVHEI
jgi:formylmethanofuran dehydrogenase subunit E